MVGRKILFVICLLSQFIPFALAHTHAYGEEHSLDFNDSGSVIVDDDVQRTYQFPDINTGLNYDFETNRFRPVLTVEVLDNIDLRYYNLKGKVEVGVGEDLAFTTFQVNITSIIEISVGPSYGYDTKVDEQVFGVSFLITKF